VFKRAGDAFIYQVTEVAVRGMELGFSKAHSHNLQHTQKKACKHLNNKNKKGLTEKKVHRARNLLKLLSA